MLSNHMVFVANDDVMSQNVVIIIARPCERDVKVHAGN